jgi:hypothetical protein
LLIEDLGLDSLKFVDLTLSLERVLPTSEFPMQYWVDSRIESGLPLNVGGLVEECAAILSRHSAPAVNRELA